MAKKKKEPKVEKVFKGKDEKRNKKDKKAEVQPEEVLPEVEESSKSSNIDDFLGVEEAPVETPEDNLTEQQKNKLEKINTLKSKISKILQSSNIEIVDGARDFQMMKRSMCDAVLDMPEVNRFSKGIFSWVGFKKKWLEYENIERKAGETKWNFWKLFLY